MQDNSYDKYIEGSLLRSIKKLCSPMEYSIISNGRSVPHYTNHKKFIKYIFEKENEGRIHEAFTSEVNGFILNIQYNRTKYLIGEQTIRHFTVFCYDSELNNDGFGLPYNYICKINENDNYHFCAAVLDTLFGFGIEERDSNFCYRVSLFTGIVCFAEFIRAKQSIATTVIAMILGLIFPHCFGDIRKNVMWFTQQDGGNCFRFNGSHNLVKICMKIINILAPENNEKRNEIKDKIINMIQAAYGLIPNTNVKDFREFFGQFDIDPKHANMYLSEILKECQQVYEKLVSKQKTMNF